jgi:hypothetical protein
LSGNSPFSHLQGSSLILVFAVHVHVQISSNSILSSITPFAENVYSVNAKKLAYPKNISVVSNILGIVSQILQSWAKGTLVQMTRSVDN